MISKKQCLTGLNYLYFFGSYLVLSKGMVLVFLVLKISNVYNRGIFICGLALSIAAVALFLYCWKETNLIKVVGPDTVSRTKKACSLVLVFIVFLLISYLASLVTGPSEPVENTFSHLKETNTYMFLFYFIRTVFIVPIYEEVMFRGFLLGVEKKFLNTRKIRQRTKQALFIFGIILNSLLFAYLHHAPTVLGFGLFSIFGLLSSGLYLYTKDLKCSIIFHQLNNLFAILSIF